MKLSPWSEIRKKLLVAWWLPVGCLIVIGVGIYVIITPHPSSHSGSFGSNRPVVTSPVTPMAVYQPPSAKQVADSLGCKKFEDHGPSQVGGSTDSGSCWIGNVKYAINTFPSLAVRNSWLRSAEPLGVVPKWETDTSVTYPSVS